MEIDNLKILSKQQILDWYIDDVLKGEKPRNVYVFSQKHNITEQEFYGYFSDIESIEAFFFEAIFDATIITLKSTEEYETFAAEEKWLSFYYTYFENLKINRSFVKEIVKPNSLRDLKKFSGLRKAILHFGKENQENHKYKETSIQKIQNKLENESMWLHFLSVLKFWLNDASRDFEKTDLYIEKSIYAGLELKKLPQFKHIKDFSKFLFKEIKP